jgi:glyoxylase-like metal-dependent hydrolase (beta-lactamase superfamily II)
MKQSYRFAGGCLPAVLLLLAPMASLAKQALVEAISAEKITDQITCLVGAGGNVAVLRGPGGLLVIDSKMAPDAPRLRAAIRKVSPLPVRLLINTHYHRDHVGGNPLIGKGARILAQAKCRAKLLAGLAKGQTAAGVGAPTETYEKEFWFEFGGEPVRLIHFGPGHTGGDSVVVFERAKVVHTGDLFFHGMPPYIDVEAGADTENWIHTIHTLAERYPDYKVIPGHGKPAGMREFKEFAAYLGYLRAQVGAAIQAGKSRAQTMDSIDMSRYAQLAERGEFLTRRNNVGWVYDELTRKK